MQEQTQEPPRMELGDLMYVGLIIGVTGIILAFTADVQSDIGEDFTADSYAKNITDNALEGTDNVSKKMGTIGTVAAIMVVIGLLLTGFGGFMRR